MADVEKVRELIANQLGKKIEEVTEDKDIVKDLGADSLDAVEMIMTLEETYGITVSDEEGSNIKTVADIIKLIDKK